MKIFSGFLIFCQVWVIISFLAGCDISENVIEPGISFSKIYNSNSFTDEYDPLDVVQTSDSGYLLLAAKGSWSTYLLKTDASGEFVWDQTLPEPFVNPLPNLLSIGSEHYLVCMDELNLGTYILKINHTGGTPEVVYHNPDLTYPLAAHVTAEGSYLIQGYERKGRKTLLMKISSGFVLEWEKKYDILEDVEERIIKHLSRTGDRLPFFNGYAEGGGNSGYYFFNGFNNFTLSLTFIDPSDGTQLGVLNGFRDQGYINAALPLLDQTFALSRSSFGDNYLLPFATLNARSIASSQELLATGFPEIASSARVVIKPKNINGREVILYATHTKSNRIVLYAYHAEDGALLGFKYLGQTSPYEIGSIVSTTDGGLIVLGRTYVAGRFPRLCLFKLSQEEVSDLLVN